MLGRIHIGIEIGPEAVRGVTLEGSRKPRLTGWAEQTVSAPHQLAQALAEVASQLDRRGRTQVLLFGSGARHLHQKLPRSSTPELRRAVAIHAAQSLGAPAESFLSGSLTLRVPGQRGQEVASVFLPREPVESWTNLLAVSHLPPAAIVTPGIALLASSAMDLPQDEGLLWVELGGSRVCLILLKGRRILQVQEIPRRPLEAGDPVGTIEQRLNTIEHIDAAVAHYAERYDHKGLRRIVFCGAGGEIEPLAQQLDSMAQATGLTLITRDMWQGLDGAPEDPGLASRLAAAVRAARTPKTTLAPVPPAVRGLRLAARKRRLAMAAAVTAVLAAGGLTLHLAETHQRLLERRTADSARLFELLRPERGDLVPEAGAPPETSPPVQDWSGLLVEAGLLAKPGIDYDRLVLSMDEDGPTLGLVGRARSHGTEETGLLLAGLHEGLLSSPYGLGLPRVAAGSQKGDRRGRKVRFAIEGTVSNVPSPE